ncbi:methyl-accepting chemotaxis protein [Ktedonobacter robiniae]|uniref:Methyl-accepting transducer domain-containing protein n=1 Tax=Ktedonobacter robiniae TaxID=2778365 RepID=A0ABQ3UJH2_9CHLR|nr:methyl-accepting chemotaxis protein [Ktedonobacter robiniae]GHO52815.1 hypothetical protein KSB_12900 [Ktedonobacter robiniae]
MAELHPKLKSRPIPLRVRLRAAPSAEQHERAQVAEEQAIAEVLSTQSVPNGETKGLFSYALDDVSQRRGLHIKELLRLGNLLRADLRLDEVLQQIVAAIANCTGFRALAINLVYEQEQVTRVVACIGVSTEDIQRLRENPEPLEGMLALMRPEYQISQSYFVSHTQLQEKFADIVSVPAGVLDSYEEGQWHPEDTLLIPLYSLREERLLGILSLGDPEDGLIPSRENVELAELFAQQATIAIDNARLFQEREEEHRALEEGVAHLREEMEQLRSGDLRVRLHSQHEKLQPIAESINTVVGEIGSLLSRVQMVTQAVDEHTRSVRHSSESLARNIAQQERQVNQISTVIEQIAEQMQSVSQKAATLSQTLMESVEVTKEAQGAVDRAVDGMGMVREATLESARTMKALSESCQQVNEVVSDISDLSVRMHHVALNAAIEATRVGERGQGFGLVAQEMRTLASYGSLSARKVGFSIRGIQHETTAMSQSVEQNTQRVVMQTELVMQTGVALEAIGAVTEEFSSLVKSICDTSEQQMQGAQMVTGSVQEILRMTGDITQHTREMQSSLNHLLNLSDALRSRMSVFRISYDLQM